MHECYFIPFFTHYHYNKTLLFSDNNITLHYLCISNISAYQIITLKCLYTLTISNIDYYLACLAYCLPTFLKCLSYPLLLLFSHTLFTQTIQLTCTTQLTDSYTIPSIAILNFSIHFIFSSHFLPSCLSPSLSFPLTFWPGLALPKNKIGTFTTRYIAQYWQKYK